MSFDSRYSRASCSNSAFSARPGPTTVSDALLFESASPIRLHRGGALEKTETHTSLRRELVARCFSSSGAALIKHRRVSVAGVDVFYREAGPKGAPTVLLPHGYPCSSYQFRNLMPLLADRWRLLAPDFPGCGYSETPENFRHDFDGYADFLERFLQTQGVDRFVVYLHDFGSQIGLRLAAKYPERIAGLIIQNGDIYKDALGPKYDALFQIFREPNSAAARAEIARAVTEEGFREEFLNDVSADVAESISPDLWKLHWALMTPKRREIAIDVIAGLKENLEWFPRYQSYLRTHQPPTLIVWGPRDGYMPERSARAYLRDLPNAELHLFEEGGHWLLETHLHDVAARIRPFLSTLRFTWDCQLPLWSCSAEHAPPKRERDLISRLVAEHARDRYAVAR